MEIKGKSEMEMGKLILKLIQKKMRWGCCCFMPFQQLRAYQGENKVCLTEMRENICQVP